MTPQEIKMARLTLGLTTKAFGEAVGVTERTVLRWQKGQSIPTEVCQFKIQKLLEKK